MGNLARAAYAKSAYDASVEIGKISNWKAEYDGRATWLFHVACFHHHVFQWAFADAPLKRVWSETRHSSLRGGWRERRAQEERTRPENGCRDTMSQWKETVWSECRRTADIEIRRLCDLDAAPGMLIRDVYFEGADVLRCTAGRFRFVFDGNHCVEIGPGEVLVTYPDHRVTIEALEDENHLVYGIFNGDDVEEYFDSLGLFHALHGKTTPQEELLAELKRRLAEQGGECTQQQNTCLSLLTDILSTFAKDLHEQGYGKIAGIVRQIKVNLRSGVVRLEPLCEQLQMSRSQLHAVFVRAGLGSPSSCIRAEQLRLVMRLLRTTRLPVTDIARKAGFISMTHFANFMRRQTGKSARAWRMGSSRPRVLSAD